MTRLCADCGGPLDRGWSNEGFHPGTRTRRCLVCRAIDGLPTFAPPAREKPLHECACGCGRVGIVKGRGMVSVCYQRLRRAGR